MVDVFELVGEKLEWRQGASIIPSDTTCGDFWADGEFSRYPSNVPARNVAPEVRTSSSAKTLFGSTRGLTPSTRGFVVAFALLPSGLLASTTPSHRFETRTSGGWANAIAPCPYEGPNGQVWLTLTDSEIGFVQLLQWTENHGFNVVDEVVLGDDIGASVAVSPVTPTSSSTQIYLTQLPTDLLVSRLLYGRDPAVQKLAHNNLTNQVNSRIFRNSSVRSPHACPHNTDPVDHLPSTTRVRKTC